MNFEIYCSHLWEVRALNPLDGNKVIWNVKAMNFEEAKAKAELDASKKVSDANEHLNLVLLSISLLEHF